YRYGNNALAAARVAAPRGEARGPLTAGGRLVRSDSGQGGRPGEQGGTRCTGERRRVAATRGPGGSWAPSGCPRAWSWRAAVTTTTHRRERRPRVPRPARRRRPLRGRRAPRRPGVAPRR